EDHEAVRVEDAVVSRAQVASQANVELEPPERGPRDDHEPRPALPQALDLFNRGGIIGRPSSVLPASFGERQRSLISPELAPEPEASRRSCTGSRVKKRRWVRSSNPACRYRNSPPRRANRTLPWAMFGIDATTTPPSARNGRTRCRTAPGSRRCSSTSAKTTASNRSAPNSRWKSS